MSRTSNYGVVETLVHKDNQSGSACSDSADGLPFLYISPKTRVISRMVAVPLVGSMAPKLQASLRGKK